MKYVHLWLQACDHPFLAALYCTIQSEHYLHFVMEYCPGGELYKLLYAQKGNRFQERDVQFYAAEVLVSLQARSLCCTHY